MMRLRNALVLGATCLPLVLDAQVRGAVYGLVRAREGGMALAHAVVSIDSLGIERLADGHGRFRLETLPAGRHQLRVRSLGFAPGDTTVVVVSAEVDSIVVELRPLPTPMATVRVHPDDWCTAPGRPRHGDDPAFASIFEQMEQNAARLRLLDETYPYATWVERKLGFRRRDGSKHVERTDTLVDRSEVAWHYKPGTVIGKQKVRDRVETIIALPTLRVIADPAFQRTHCFAFAGVEDFDGRRVLRIDYSTSRKLRTPDVNGSVFLDSASYQIVATRARLSRIPSELRSMSALEATVWFREVAPGLPIADRIESIKTLRNQWGRDNVVARTETQRHMMIRFDGRSP